MPDHSTRRDFARPHVPRAAKKRAGQEKAPDDPKAGDSLRRRAGAASNRHGGGAQKADRQAPAQGPLSGRDQARPLHRGQGRPLRLLCVPL